MDSKVKKSLLNKKNVVAVGEGIKWTDGEDTSKEAILVFVTEKEPLHKLNAKDIIPKSISGKPTDVVGKTGSFNAFTHTRKTRPVAGGNSTGHLWITAGTLGGWFKDSSDEIVGLSNNHVLAADNRGKKYDPKTGRGHWTIQPGKYDNGKWRQNRIGQLKDYVPLQKNNNYQDSAICRLDDEDIADLQIAEVGYINDFNLKPKVNQRIKKVGRTTGKTTGKIIAVNATVRVYYDNGVREFEDQIIADNLSRGGDSGSLLLDESNNVLGLLFAGSTSMTVYNKICYIKDRYELSIIKPIEESINIIYEVDGKPQSVSTQDPIAVLEDARLKARNNSVKVTIFYRANDS